jgi:DNA alkylation damage repair protein AlkB
MLRSPPRALASSEKMKVRSRCTTASFKSNAASNPRTHMKRPSSHLAAPETTKEINRFRLAEKRFKLYKGKDKRRRATDLSSVIDVSKESSKGRVVRVSEFADSKLVGSDSSASSESNKRSNSFTGTVYRVPEVDGLFLISGALDMKEQVNWSCKAAREFSNCIYTNLSNIHGIQPNHWKAAVEAKQIMKGQGFANLRWSSLGYHYDWTKRVYYKNAKSDFPPSLASLAEGLARRVGFNMNSEAALINYYPSDGSMGGHIDDAELTLSYPIVSISLGCSAIFLIGGKTKQIEPTAILVRSGDAIIMSGESRLCYHGVPRILKGTCSELVKALQQTSTSQNGELNLLAKYLQESRVNLNVRQVTDEKCNFSSSEKGTCQSPSADNKQ